VRTLVTLVLLAGSLLSASLCAQGYKRTQFIQEPKKASALAATLKSLRVPAASRTAIADELTEKILALAEHDHEPARGVVSGFANDLVNALYRRVTTNKQLDDLELSIQEILKPTGSTSRSASRVREVLRTVGAERPDVVTKSFISVAEDVRGPDDSPVEPQRRIK
jgi:hypothetical protein